MPDCQPSSGGLGDSCFTFRYMRDATEEGKALQPLWGFSLFRAQRESTQRRGVFQKSIVLLSPFPYFRLYRAAVALLADAYFTSGAEAFHAAVKQLSGWPLAHAPSSYSLTILDTSLTLALVACEAGPVYALPRGDAAAGGALREARAARSLCELGASCWTLWKLLLMGESVVVLTPSPHQCSDIVLALPCLISPLPCMSDMRPYLTVHARDWDAHFSGTAPPPGAGTLIGATNPMLARAPPSWVSLLSLEEHAADAPAASVPGGESSKRLGAGGWGWAQASAPAAAPSVFGFSFGWSGEGGSHSEGDGSGDWPGGVNALWASATWTSSIDVAVQADERVLHHLQRETEQRRQRKGLPERNDGEGGTADAEGGEGGTASRQPQLDGSGGQSTATEAAQSNLSVADLAQGLPKIRDDDEPVGERLLREHFEQLTLSFLQPLDTFMTMGSLSLRTPAEGSGPIAMLHDWSYETLARARPPSNPHPNLEHGSNPPLAPTLPTYLATAAHEPRQGLPATLPRTAGARAAPRPTAAD